MKRACKPQGNVCRQRVPSLKLTPIAAACSGLLIMSGMTHAQQAAPASSVETVVVTGMKRSIETSVQAKRDSDSIVEVVSAEEIGKLPDVSIAESIARLTGLTAQRVDGRSQVISIRGMAPKYGVTLLNGREMVSTGDNRAVEYDQFPSELMNRVSVYKTPDASLSAIGLSGTVDMRSIRPLDFKERQLSVSVRGEKADNGKLTAGSDALGGRFNVSYVDQFADGKLGVALGYAHLDNPGQEKYYKSWWWADTSQWGATPAGLAAGTTALQGFEAGVTSSDRKRDGFMAVVEWKPNKDFRSMVDMYVTKFDQKSDQSELQADLTKAIPAWGGTGSYTSPTVTNGLLTSATINGMTPVILARHNERKDDVFAIGWNNELKRDKWTLVADLSYSKAKRDESNGELTAQATAPLNLVANINTTISGPSSFVPSVNLADATSVLLTEVWGRGGRVSLPKVEDEKKGFKLSAKRDFDGRITSVEGGVNYSDRDKKMDRQENYFSLGAATAVPAGALLSPASLGFAGIPAVLNWNYLGAMSLYTVSPSPYPWDLANRVWTVNEELLTYYAKANFDVDMYVPVRGNFGVQVVNAKQRATGLTWNGSTLTQVAAEKTRTDALPSLNTIFDFSKLAGKGTQVRLGIAEEMARPNMEDMRAGSNISLGCGMNPCTWSGSGGNPLLDPWRAFATDLSIEKYFGKRSYVALAHFKKNLKTFVYDQSLQRDFSTIPVSAGFVIPPGFTVAPTGTSSMPANGTGGKVEGTELSFSLEGGLLHPAIDGFGLIASKSNTTSSLHEGNNVNNPLDGLSGVVSNVTLYYEKAGFSARISQRYRSPFQTRVRNQFGDSATAIISSEAIVDAQLGYAFESGPYKGLSLLLQVNNLTDTPYKTSVSSATNDQLILPERYNTYGRQIMFGLKYKL